MRIKDKEKEKAILRAAVTVFAQSGYHEAKIHRIADLAGIATGSVYSYYPNKLEILLSLFDNVWKLLFAELQAVEADRQTPSVIKLEKVIDLIFDLFMKDPALALVFVNEQAHLLRDHPKLFTPYFNSFVELGEKIVNKGIKEKTFSSKTNVNFFRIFLIGGIRDLLHHWAASPEASSLREIRAQIKIYTTGALTQT